MVFCARAFRGGYRAAKKCRGGSPLRRRASRSFPGYDFGPPDGGFPGVCVSLLGRGRGEPLRQQQFSKGTRSTAVFNPGGVCAAARGEQQHRPRRGPTRVWASPQANPGPAGSVGSGLFAFQDFRRTSGQRKVPVRGHVLRGPRSRQPGSRAFSVSGGIAVRRTGPPRGTKARKRRFLRQDPTPRETRACWSCRSGPAGKRRRRQGIRAR